MTSEVAELTTPEAGGRSVESRRRTGIRLAGRRVSIAPHNCFACGSLNLEGLRLELHSADGRCWTELTLPRRFEGWDGIAHGGILATILDEVMAWAIIEQDSWGVTARMAIEYKHPAPVGTLIRGEGWVVRSRRRLVETAARIVEVEPGRVIATAEGLYVAAPEARKRELKERYAFDLLPEDRDPLGSVDGPKADPPAGRRTGVDR